MGRDGELVGRYLRRQHPVPPPTQPTGPFTGFRRISYTEQMARYRHEHPESLPNFIPSFKRLAILSNVDGQKYTLGTEFTSCTEKGEFIFLPRINAFIHDGQSRCEIEIHVEEGKYWVTPTTAGSSGDGAVAINDVTVLERMELKFGDTLSLLEYSFQFRERQLYPTSFIYSALLGKDEAEGEGTPTSKNTTEELKSSPGQIGLIVSRILSYFPLEELKISRLVSKQWNEEAFKILKKRCTVSFDLRCGYHYANYDETMKLFRYSVEMRDHPMPNWNIVLPAFAITQNEEEDTFDSSSGKGAKLLDDLNWFLFDIDSKVHLVKKLKLGGTIKSNHDLDLRQKILQVLQGSLAEFDFSGFWSPRDYGNTGPNYRFPENIGFPKLQKFTLSMEALMYGFDDIEHYAIHTWLKGLALAINGVASLELACDARLSLTFLKYLDEVLDSFPNLKELTCHSLNPDGIKILLKLNKPLQKLKLRELEDMKREDFHDFDQLLAKHSKTLKSLQFIIPPDPGNQEDEEKICIKFPAFPKLLQLNVGWQGWEWDRRGRPLDIIKLVFPGGNINYKNDLPALKSLTIWLAEHGTYPNVEDFEMWGTGLAVQPESDNCGPLYEIFFPAIQAENPTNGEIETCESLQVLNIMTHLKTDEDEWTPLFTKNQMATISAMFPNASNYDWVSAVSESTAEEQKIVD